MLIHPGTIQEALHKQGMKANETAIVGLERNLFVKAKAKFYQDFESGRFVATLVRDSKGRIAATKPKRVA